MAIHKLYIDEIDVVNYSLIAIHTNLDDFRLAFFINKQLNLRLIKNDKNISIPIKELDVFYENFIYQNNDDGTDWCLFQNKNTILIKNNNDVIDLFFENKLESKKQVYFLSDFKKVDFFLKINHSDTINVQDIINSINKIYQVTTVYSIDIKKIKNTNNLIF